MVTYVNKNIPGNYVVMEKELDSALHNNVGNSYDHYLAGWWVLLSDGQLKFRELNPNASVEEVINMTMKVVPVPDPLVESKNSVLGKIKAYNTSDKVDNFTINGVVNAWFSVQERLNYKQSVEAAKLLGEEVLDFLVNGMPFSVSVANAEYMLAQIQRYADKCFMVTEKHKANVNALTSVEEVNAYYLYFYSSFVSPQYSYYRSYAHSVRPVLDI